MLYDNLLKQIYAQAQDPSKVLITLQMAHGQALRLAELMEGRGTDRQWFIDQLQATTMLLRRAQDRETELHRTMSPDQWYWEADGENHLESLVCPIVIQPGDLRKLLADAERKARPVDLDCVMLGEDLSDNDGIIGLLEKVVSAFKRRKNTEEFNNRPWAKIFSSRG